MAGAPVPVRPAQPARARRNADKNWSRFDIAGFATLYGATDKRGAYEESLAYFRPDDSQFTGLFDDDEVESIDAQWESSGHMQARHVARQWRDVRRISSFGPRHPDRVQFIDIAHSNTIGFLRATMDQWATRLPVNEPSEVDVAALTGQDRALTCAAAWWLQRLVLPGGGVPAGVTYTSRHGVNLKCFALWVDLGDYPSGTPVLEATSNDYSVDETYSIEATDDALLAAAKALHLMVH